MNKTNLIITILLMSTITPSYASFLATIDAANTKGSIIVEKINPYNEQGYDKDGYDRNGFNQEGFHKNTGTKYDELGYNINGFNTGGINKDTNSLYDSEGWDINGYSPKVCDFINNVTSYTYTVGDSDKIMRYEGKVVSSGSSVVYNNKYITVGIKQNTCGQVWSYCKYSVCAQNIKPT